MITHIGAAWRAAGLLPIAMLFSVRDSTAPRPSRIHDFHHGLLWAWRHRGGDPAQHGSPLTMRPKRIRQPVQLVVEGKDAYNFFREFIKNLGLVDIQVQNFGGVTDLSGFLDAFVKAPGFNAVSSIGIVRDAERRAGDDPPVDARPSPATSAFQSVQSSLRRFGLPVPDRPMERAGTVRTVSVFILPGDADDGMLETLLGRTIAGTDVDRCIGRFLQCTADSGNPVQRPEKARAHAYLSTMPQPHVSVGVAAQKGYWNFDHEAFDAVRRFLRALAQDRPAA